MKGNSIKIRKGNSIRTIKIWDTTIGKLKYTFDRSNCVHSTPIDSLISLDNGYLANGFYENSIKIWDITNRRLKYTLDESNGGHSMRVNSLILLLEYNYLASSGQDRTIKIWDLKIQR